jgi:U3 small nucleolar RNA-associated protein 15
MSLLIPRSSRQGGGARASAESRYWRSFKRSASSTLSHPCSSIHFSPVTPFNMAVTTSLSVLLMNAAQKQQKSLSRFNDVAYSGRYRHDGRLVAAGGEEGVVRTFEASTGAAMRTMKGHTGPVHAVRWAPGGMHLLSASDDKSVRVFDVPTGECMWARAAGHADYARSASASPMSPNIWASGAYDRTVCIWDTRSDDQRPVLRLDHGVVGPVEDVVFMPGGCLLLSAGGNEIKVWDITHGTRGGRSTSSDDRLPPGCVHRLSNHQKTITCLALDNSTSSRLLSGGLDGHVKIYSAQTFAVTHGLKYDAPVLCFALSPKNDQLVVGTSGGVLATRQRDTRTKGSMGTIHRASSAYTALGGTRAYFERGKSTKLPTSFSSSPFPSSSPSSSSSSDGQDFMVLPKHKQRLQPYDFALRKFRYQDALDAALTSRNPSEVVSVLEELVQRRGLARAITGRDEVTLEPLLSFLARYTTNPRYAPVLIDVCLAVFETYKTVVGQSESIDELLTRLARVVKTEIKQQRALIALLGSLDAVIAGSKHPAAAEAAAPGVPTAMAAVAVCHGPHVTARSP